MLPKLDELAIKCATFTEEMGRIIDEIDFNSDIMTDRANEICHDIVHEIMALQGEIWNIKTEMGNETPNNEAIS